MWLAPRGSGKSLTLAVVFPLWLAISRPENMDPRLGNLFVGSSKPIGPHNIRIAITSNSAEKAEALLFQIKSLLSSPLMTALFGALEGERWQESKADCALRTEKIREATFTALGIGSKIAGGHYDVVVADDWVTEDNARTQLQRERMSDFWKFTIKGTTEPWCRLIVAGTRYHPADWYSEIYSWHKRGLWEHLHRTPAIDDAGNSYWPEFYSYAELMSRRDQIGASAFASQYQNVIDTALGGFFKREWIEHWARWDDLPVQDRQKARTVIALDPAFAEGPKADWSVFAVVSYIAPHFYVRHVERGQWTQLHILERARALNDEYRPHLFGIEDVGAQRWLIQELQHTSRLPLRALPPRGTDKVGRADKVRTYFERGQVFIEGSEDDGPSKAHGIPRLVDEMLAFPSQSKVPGWDDTVDALVWALLLMIRPTTRLHKSPRRRF
jgi:predicted phage terminase large subunit-like protein